MMKSQTSIARSLQPSVALGLFLTCTLASPLSAQGRLYSWGTDVPLHYEFGQITDTPEEAHFVDIAAGATHTTALLSDGTLYSWGDDQYGQVTATPSGSGFTQVVAGHGHTLALRTDGTIVAWGQDLGGEVSNTPTYPGFTMISAAYGSSLALRLDGSLAAWGPGNHADLPTGTGFTYIDDSSSGWALRTGGFIAYWGTPSGAPVTQHPTGPGFTELSVTSDYGLALQADGTIVGWGTDAGGILSAIPTGTGFTQVEARQGHAFALRADGSIAAWGYSTHGLFTGVPPGEGYSKLSSSPWFHAVALRYDNPGEPYCFGDGSGSTCPCGGIGAADSGCSNTVSSGATLVGSGPAYLAVERFQLDVSNLPPGTPGLVLRGSNQLNGGLGSALGDGILCVTGVTARSQVQASTPSGTATFTGFSGQSFGTASFGLGVPTHYQYWYRDGANSCSGSRFNLSNAWTTIWLP